MGVESNGDVDAAEFVTVKGFELCDVEKWGFVCEEISRRGGRGSTWWKDCVVITE